MSWAEDEGYDGYDFPFDDELAWCDKCQRYIYPPHQEFCYNCLSIEDKWKLGIL